MATPVPDGQPEFFIVVPSAASRRLRVWLDGLDERWQRCGAADVLGQMADRPGSRFLMPAESPRRILLGAAEQADAAAAEQALAAWAREASGLVEAVQCAPQRCLLIDADEAASQPQAWKELLAAWSRGAVEAPPIPAAAANLPGELIASTALEDTPHWAAVYQKLLACSAVVSDGFEHQARVPALPALWALNSKSKAVTKTIAEARLPDLLGPLHDAQEQAARCHLELQALRSRPGALARDGAPVLRCVGLRCLGEAGAGSHRHVDFRLLDASTSVRRWATGLDARLVLHRGRPGIAIFSDGARTAPLAAWHAHGRESEREFMLFIPSDEGGRQALNSLGATDWSVLCDLAGLLLRGCGEAELGSWQMAAHQLCRQLSQGATRLRYDGLRVQHGADGLDVVFERALYGATAFAALTLRWHPAVDGGSLELLARTEGPVLPLSAWPVDDTGTPSPAWPVPVGRGLTGGDKQAVWGALCAEDRELLLAILDAMPAAAQRARDADLPDVLRSQASVEAARALHQDAQRSWLALRVRRALRRLVRRA
ncbi:hypothetical protein LOC51_27600 [Rubrivivax sp. JA1024]|nr:hypothetical protein [Rubrivivax sp. JA1024]